MSTVGQGPITVTVKEAQEISTATIRQNLMNAAAGYPVEMNDVLNFVSDPGMAKSALVKAAHATVAADEEFISKMGKKIGEVWDVPCDPILYWSVLTTATLEGTDLGGLPAPNWEEGIMERLRFQCFLPSAGMHVLFFDEVTKAGDEGVFNVLGQMVYNGKVGEFTLPPGVSYFLAGNHRKNRSGDKELPRFLTNRTCNLQVELPLSEWLGWASMNGIHHLIISYFKSGGNSEFFSAFDASHVSNPTARTWEKVSDKLNTGHLKGSLLRSVISGYVGPAAGSSFITYLNIADQLIPAADVFADPKNAPIPDRPAAQWAMMSSLANAVNKKTISALDTYIQRFEDELSNGREIVVFALTLLLDRDRSDREKGSSVFFTEAGRKMIARYSELVIS